MLPLISLFPGRFTVIALHQVRHPAKPHDHLTPAFPLTETIFNRRLQPGYPDRVDFPLPPGLAADLVLRALAGAGRQPFENGPDPTWSENHRCHYPINLDQTAIKPLI